jgi:uncharacterized OB-fold protein
MTQIPPELLRAIETHGHAVAAADNRKVLADFLPDRVGQLIASSRLPEKLRSAEVRTITAVGDDRYDAVIRYTAPDDTWAELRSRWVKFDDGTWRVFSVRNIPATAPWIDLTGPSDDGLDEPHWDGLRAGRLLLQRCDDCTSWIWSPRPICPVCRSFATGWYDVEPVGTIYSWTRTWQPFTPESSGHLPYTTILVELPGAGGRRILGVLDPSDEITPVIGAHVTGQIHQPPDDGHWPLIRWTLEAAA